MRAIKEGDSLDTTVLADVYYELAKANVLLEDPEEAVENLDRALGLDPSSATAHVLRGQANMIFGRYEEALVDLSNAIRQKYLLHGRFWCRNIINCR